MLQELQKKLHTVADQARQAYTEKRMFEGMDFVAICRTCTTVICCRVSPKQKGAVVRLIKQEEKAITLAIGDGANDCNMIMSADVGIGIRGLEGLQAFNVSASLSESDYGISQFRFLQYLLLVHGRWFYKNFVCVLPQYFLGISAESTSAVSGFSGQKLYNDILYQFYNVFFTFVPIMVFAVLDQDVPKKASLKYPELYRAGKERMNVQVCLGWIASGVWHGLVVFFIPYLVMSNGNTTHPDGKANDIWLVGSVVFFQVCLVTNLTDLLLELAPCHKAPQSVPIRTRVVALGFFLSLLAWVLFQGYISGLHGVVVTSEFYGSMQRLLGCPMIYLIVITSSAMALMADIHAKGIKCSFFPSEFKPASRHLDQLGPSWTNVKIMKTQHRDPGDPGDLRDLRGALVQRQVQAKVEPEDAQRWPPRGCGAALISSHGRLTAKVGILSDATDATPANSLEVPPVLGALCFGYAASTASGLGGGEESQLRQQLQHEAEELDQRRIEIEINKMKLAETISRFDSTLQDLKNGNAEGIICSICSNASEVLESIQNVLDLWGPFQRILTENVDSIRDVDGSVDHEVLEDLSSKTEPLLKACDEVVSRLIIEAKAAHQWQHSIVQDVAFRQRTLIQGMAKALLFLSQGVSMASNMESLGETKGLFEASHKGIIRGVPFAGIPVLTKLCTMHQLSVVTLYYQQLRPLLNRVMNSVTSSEAQQAADDVATDVVTGTEPLFDAMVSAVDLVMNDSGSCQPWTAMSSSDWRFFLNALAHQRLLTQQMLQEVTQVAMKVNVKSAQVEIIVHDSEATENLRSLIEGNGLLGIPPPPTQEMLNSLLETWKVWETMEVEIQNVVHLDVVSDAMILRVFRLSKEVLLHLEIIMQNALEMVRNTTVPGYLMNLATEQAVLVSKVVEEACLINLGIEVDEKWRILNKSRLVQQMKAAMDLFSELDQEALVVARGAAATLLIELGPSCVKAFDEVSSSITSGENVSCENRTLSADEWKKLHREVAELATLQSIGKSVGAVFSKGRLQ
eukprot:s36_g32.t1